MRLMIRQRRLREHQTSDKYKELLFKFLLKKKQVEEASVLMLVKLLALSVMIHINNDKVAGFPVFGCVI